MSASSDELVCMFCTAGASPATAGTWFCTTCTFITYFTKSCGDSGHHAAEHLEALTLPLGERVLLPHRPQVDAALEVVHLLEVLAPALVDDAQHHLAFDLAEHLDTQFLLAPLVVRRRLAHHEVVDLVGAIALAQIVVGDVFGK
jgi:hypothetical protein